jgi:hypothetical protein
MSALLKALMPTHAALLEAISPTAHELLREPVKLMVTTRCYGGAWIARCNGKTASCTSCEKYAVRRAAEKAASKHFPPLTTEPELVETVPGVWTATFKQ